MSEHPVEKSLKRQAEELMERVDKDLQEVETTPATTQAEVESAVDALMKKVFGIISEVDIEAAEKRVEALRQKYPQDSAETLAQKLIREKCRRTGTVGAVTAGAGLIPGLGTAAAVTLGVAADIGATFKLQAELVLEIAAAYDYPLTDEEKQRLVLVITGISAGTATLTRKAGQTAAVKIGEKLATRSAYKAFTKAIPVVGMAANAGTNVLSTYIIGQRADAYFRLGPEAVGSWSDSLRAVTGVDERRLGEWVAESGKTAGAALMSGAEKIGQAGKTAGEAVASGAGKAAETVGPVVTTGARKAADVTQSGFRAYSRRFVAFWGAIFRGLGRVFGFLWAVVSFIPRRLGGLFKGKDRDA